MQKYKKGFTLIEVLVALVIFSFSMATIYWGYSQAIRNSKKALDLIDEINSVKNFYTLNKKEIVEDERDNFLKDNFLVKKKPLSVMINDSFKLEDENIFSIKIKRNNGNYEFLFIEAK